MNCKRLVLGCLFSLIVISLNAQDRYMVFFASKDSVRYSVDQPLDFLTQRSIDRRNRLGIDITEQDLPVDKQYVDSLRKLNVEVFFTSKWVNGAVAQMEQAQISEVKNLAFVDSVVYIAAGAKLSHNKQQVTIPTTFKEPNNVNSSSDFQHKLIDIDDMHEDGYKGEGVLIAVFDAGYQGVNEFSPFEHLFDDHLKGMRDFVKNTGNVFQYHDHGTASLSCIAANFNEDYLGVAPEADYILCVTEDVTSEYRIEEYNWLLAAEYADSLGADVISSSLGYSTFSDESMNYTYDDLDGKTTIVAQAAELAFARGIVVVNSAGNEGNGSWQFMTSPADAPNTLAVGSVNADRGKSSFSSVGPTPDGRVKPDVATLGSFVSIFGISGEPGQFSGSISTGSGTSFAAPQITGLVAGLMQANPEWTHEEIVSAVRSSGSLSQSPNNQLGYGIPNYQLAVQDRLISAADILSDKITVFPNPFDEGIIKIDFGGINLTSAIEITLMDQSGKTLYQQRHKPRNLPNQLVLAFDAQESGVYFLTLQSRKLQKVVKLIKI